MTREAAAGLEHGWREALNDQDLDAVMAFYASDCVVESPFAAGKVQGVAANAKVYRAFFDAFPDVTVQVDEVLIDGERVVEIGTMRATDTGGFMGMAPSGKLAVIPIVFLLKIRNGQIEYERRVYDFTGLLVQVGVLKARPA